MRENIFHLSPGWRHFHEGSNGSYHDYLWFWWIVMVSWVTSINIQAWIIQCHQFCGKWSGKQWREWWRESLDGVSVVSPLWRRIRPRRMKISFSWNPKEKKESRLVGEVSGENGEMRTNIMWSHAPAEMRVAKQIWVSVR